MILGIMIDATIMSPFPAGKVRITLAADRQVTLALISAYGKVES